MQIGGSGAFRIGIRAKKDVISIDFYDIKGDSYDLKKATALFNQCVGD